MRVPAPSLALACALASFAPCPAEAQDYRASVLYTEPANFLAASEPAVAAPTTTDSSAQPTFHPPRVARAQPTIVAPILGSVLGGAALGVAGFLIGNGANPSSFDDIPVGGIIGYTIGETIGVPLGAHLGNGRRGNLAGDLGVSLLGHLAAFGLLSLDSGGGAYLVGLAGQIAITVANERHQGKKRAEREAAAAP